MAVRPNHTIIAVVRVGDTSLDYLGVKEYIGAHGGIASQHYAFLVSEIEFEEILQRIRQGRRSYWADRGRREREVINTWDNGRGLSRPRILVDTSPEEMMLL
jgi:hypothetical protein